jgi:hypothetical protein
MGSHANHVGQLAPTMVVYAHATGADTAEQGI